MADEPTGDGSAAEVTLTADTSPFEAALNKAAEKAKGWGDKVRTALDTVNNFSTEKLSGLQEKLSGIGELPSELIGATAGTGIGAAIGVWFGGPAGAALGSKIGNALGEQVGRNFDLTPLAKAAEEGIAALQDSFAGVGDAFGKIGKDATETFDRIGKEIKSLSFRDFYQALFEDNTEAMAKILGVWESVTGELGGLFDRGLDRVRNAIDAVWEKIKEPVARVADFIQGLLVRFGLLSKGTESWGDAIRKVGDVGKTVIGGLAYAFGYLEGIVKKVGGYVTEFIVVPIAAALKEMYGALAKAAQFAADNLPEGTARTLLGEYAKGARMLSTEIERSMGKLKDKAKELQGTNLEEQARKRQQDAMGALDRGAEGNQKLDQFWAVQKAFREFFAAKPPEESPPAPRGEPIRPLHAMLKDSREATNTIIRATMDAQGVPGNEAPDKKIAAAVEAANKQREDGNKKLDAVNDKLSRLNDHIEKALVVKMV